METSKKDAVQMRRETLETTTNPSVWRRLRVRKLVKDNGLCMYCVKKSGRLDRGENRGFGGRKIRKNWKKFRKTQYK